MYLQQLTTLKYLCSAFIWMILYAINTTNKQSYIQYITSLKIMQRSHALSEYRYVALGFHAANDQPRDM